MKGRPGKTWATIWNNLEEMHRQLYSQWAIRANFPNQTWNFPIWNFPNMEKTWLWSAKSATNQAKWKKGAKNAKKGQTAVIKAQCHTLPFTHESYMLDTSFTWFLYSYKIKQHRYSKIHETDETSLSLKNRFFGPCGENLSALLTMRHLWPRTRTAMAPSLPPSWRKSYSMWIPNSPRKLGGVRESKREKCEETCGPFQLLCVQGFSKEEGSTWTNHTPESYLRIIPRIIPPNHWCYDTIKWSYYYCVTTHGNDWLKAREVNAKMEESWDAGSQSKKGDSWWVIKQDVSKFSRRSFTAKHLSTAKLCSNN